MATARIQPINESLREWAAATDRLVQSDLARLAGVSRNAVSTWCNGHVTPGHDQWPVIERFFGKKPGTLARMAARYYTEMAEATMRSARLGNEQFATAAKGGRTTGTRSEIRSTRQPGQSA